MTAGSISPRGALLRVAAGSLPVLLVLFAALPGTRAQTHATATPANCANPSANAGVLVASAGAANGAVPASLQANFNLVRQSTFPELANKVVRSRTFSSSSDYFRTRFSISRFLFLQRMHYFVDMNPRIAASGPSEESVCAILAHELVHIVGMSSGNRIHLLGLARLASGSYTARFERAADLEAIRRGYGPGLITYREWVYKNIPASALRQKKRNYFSPEEITEILRLSQADSSLFAYWKAHVPLSLREINGAAVPGTLANRKQSNGP
jgi:hypothetical protein